MSDDEFRQKWLFFSRSDIAEELEVFLDTLWETLEPLIIPDNFPTGW